MGSGVNLRKGPKTCLVTQHATGALFTKLIRGGDPTDSFPCVRTVSSLGCIMSVWLVMPAATGPPWVLKDLASKALFLL